MPISVSRWRIEGSSPADLRQAAQHCLKVLGSIDNPSLDRVVNTLVMVQLNCLVNMKLESEEERDPRSILIARAVLQGMEDLDEFDRSVGGNADYAVVAGANRSVRVDQLPWPQQLPAPCGYASVHSGDACIVGGGVAIEP